MLFIPGTSYLHIWATQAMPCLSHDRTTPEQLPHLHWWYCSCILRTEAKKTFFIARALKDHWDSLGTLVLGALPDGTYTSGWRGNWRNLHSTPSYMISIIKFFLLFFSPSCTQCNGQPFCLWSGSLFFLSLFFWRLVKCWLNFEAISSRDWETVNTFF